MNDILPEANFSSAIVNANGINSFKVMRKTIRILYSANQHLRVHAKLRNFQIYTDWKIKQSYLRILLKEFMKDELQQENN